MPNHQYADTINCPRCGSIQVKAMVAQPKKYPRPTDPQALLVWQDGYDCKKCGTEFVVNRNAPPAEPPKRGFFAGLISLIIKIVLAIIIVLAVLAYLTSKNNETTKPDSIEQVIHEKEQTSQPDIKIPTVEELNETFPVEAEKAAHEEYPNDPTKAEQASE